MTSTARAAVLLALLTSSGSLTAGQLVPWGVDLVHAREVWPVTQGEGVNVAIIDTGIDYTHADLRESYAGGTNTLFGDENPRDFDSHGTGCAGIVAAADNDLGIVGVAPRATLWAVKEAAMSDDPLGRRQIQGDPMLRAIDWIVAKKRAMGGRWIVNCSCGSDPHTAEGFASLIAEGILVVAASGNHGRNETSPPNFYPAGFPGVLGVGAIDQRSDLAFFSDEGPQVSVVAPGQNVLTTMSRDQGEINSVSAHGVTWYGAAVNGSLRVQRQTTVQGGPLVDCGSGKPDEFPVRTSGYTAVIRISDELTFNQQGRNAAAAGATAVVLINPAGRELPYWTYFANDSSGFVYPMTLVLNANDGEELLGALGSAATMEQRYGDYGIASGTSFASPHVAGVAALVWSAAPNATAAEVRDAIVTTARDLGEPGRDDAYGYGLVDAYAATKKLAPQRFPVGGRRILKH